MITTFPRLFQFLFQQLGVIIAIVKQHIRNYLDDIFSLIKVSDPGVDVTDSVIAGKTYWSAYYVIILIQIKLL